MKDKQQHGYIKVSWHGKSQPCGPIDTYYEACWQTLNKPWRDYSPRSRRSILDRALRFISAEDRADMSAEYIAPKPPKEGL